MKIKKALYNEALGEVLDTFEVNECELFESNKETCREGRMILVVALRPFLSVQTWQSFVRCGGAVYAR